jgi:K+-transporting ATPase ATPase C chain
MLRQLRPAVVLLILMSALTGLVYPLAITGIAQAVLLYPADGSLVTNRDGAPVGSALIGQNFASDRYFHGRPSATQTQDPAHPDDPSKTIDAPYNADNSTGSNLGPTSQKLVDRVKADVEAKRAAGWAAPIPVDAVTTSASGLDPEISPATAFAQVPAVAKARGLAEEKVRTLVAAQVKDRALGLIGEPRVNVLRLNLALDALAQAGS